MKNVQVDSKHYKFSEYVGEDRWCSYYKQIEEIINCKAKSVLLIGMGDGLVPNVVSQICDDIKITTFDFAEDLNPDICGDVLELSSNANIQGGGYDAVVCCQVLEHLPYEEFEKALRQINTCLKKSGKLILSLPDGGTEMAFSLRIPKFCKMSFFCRVPKIWRNTIEFNGEHYWEVNTARTYTARKVRKVIKSVFNLEKEYLVNNNHYHRFYIASHV